MKPIRMFRPSADFTLVWWTGRPRRCLSLFTRCPCVINGQLVDAGALVGARKFNQLKAIGFRPSSSCNYDFVGVDALHNAALAWPKTTTPESYAALYSMPVPTMGASRNQKRHRLALHVGAHQCAVCIVVFQKRNHRRSHRNQLLGRNVHQIDFCSRGTSTDLLADAAGNAVMRTKLAVFVHRFVGLRDDVVCPPRPPSCIPLRPSQRLRLESTLRYGVSIKPYSLIARIRGQRDRSSRCSGLPASQSGTCVRNANGERRAPQSWRAHGSDRPDPAQTDGAYASAPPAGWSDP